MQTPQAMQESFVGDLSGGVAQLDNALGASVNANAASDALVSINNRMSHNVPPLCYPTSVVEFSLNNIPRRPGIAMLGNRLFPPFTE